MFEYFGVQIDIKVSIGVVSFLGDVVIVEDLLWVVDGWMYVQKVRVKNSNWCGWLDVVVFQLG